MVRVLIVDDEYILLDMIAALIEELGYESIVAANGHEALAILHAQPVPPSLIITDVMMPRMNGVELAHTIRTEPRFAEVPIILMSAGGELPLTPDASYFLHKPFSIDQIADVISSLLVQKPHDLGQAAC